MAVVDPAALVESGGGELTVTTATTAEGGVMLACRCCCYRLRDMPNLLGVIIYSVLCSNDARNDDGTPRQCAWLITGKFISFNLFVLSLSSPIPFALFFSAERDEEESECVGEC